MMGEKAIQPKLYVSFSLDAAVPQDHLVRRLATAVDLGFVRGLTRRSYSHTGRPSVDPIVLFKLWLLGYLFNVTSERRLCQEASLNLAWRWFLGYELDEPIPDHSVLTKARERFGPAIYERFFRRIVQLCEDAGLIKGDVVFVDSTLSKANAAIDSMRSRTLTEQRLNKPERYVRNLWVFNSEQDELAAPPPRPRDPRGRKPLPASERRQRGELVNQSAVSSTDPDAQLFWKRGRAPMLCHKTHLVVDGGKANIITAVEVRPPCEADSAAVEKVLLKHTANVGRRPRELVGDRGYGNEAAFKACLQQDVTPTLATRNLTNHYGTDRDEFTYLQDRDLYVCPQGKELAPFTVSQVKRLTIYRPIKGTCASCPLKARCAPGASDRSIKRRWDVDVWEQIHRHLRSRHARRMLRRRKAVIERVIAVSKGNHGLERAQFRGRGKMQIQALFSAASFNLKQLIKRRPCPQTGWAARGLQAGAATWS